MNFRNNIIFFATFLLLITQGKSIMGQALEIDSLLKLSAIEAAESKVEILKSKSELTSYELFVISKFHGQKVEIDSALHYILLSLEIDSTYGRAHIIYGTLIAIKGDYDNAILAMNRAMECDDKSYYSLYYRGKFYLIKEEFQLANNDFLAFIQTKAEAPKDFMLNLAASYLGIGNLVEGCKYMRIAAMEGDKQAQVIIEQGCNE